MKEYFAKWISVKGEIYRGDSYYLKEDLTSKNALSICNQLKIFAIDIHYVTRCYLTRHGNGWMPNENKIELINTKTETNETGAWQGHFRTGELDTKLLNYAMNCDDTYSFRHNKHLHVTCLDQRPGFKFPYEQLLMPFKSVREQYSAHADIHSIISN